MASRIIRTIISITLALAAEATFLYPCLDDVHLHPIIQIACTALAFALACAAVEMAPAPSQGKTGKDGHHVKETRP